MGGIGSGRRNLKGTPPRKDSVSEASAQVLSGPWLQAIPAPTMPLGDVGRAKYEELTRMLFDRNRLTHTALGWAENAAVLYEQIHIRLEQKKPVSVRLNEGFQRSLAALRIAEDAAPITNPNRISKFAIHGFANRAPWKG